MSTTIQTYRYQYRPSSSSSHLPTSSFSLSPPQNTLPHHYLESPTNIFLLQPQSSANIQQPQPQQPEKIIIRQVGGPGDNHVQWVSRSEVIPYQADSEELLPSVGVGSRARRTTNGSGGVGKRRIKSLKSYTSQVHGIVHTPSWPNNDVGDRLWLRSDQPIIKGRRSVPVVNLDKGVSGEVCISNVTWHPQKRELSSTSTSTSTSTSGNTTIHITFIGAEYRHGQGPRRGLPFRMCIIQDPSSTTTSSSTTTTTTITTSSSSTSHADNDNGGVIEMISLEELETCFEDVVEDVEDVKLPLRSSRSPPTKLQILPLSDSNHISMQLRAPRGPRPRGPRGPRATAILDETDSRRMDHDGEDDDNLSHASFAGSSSKGKVAMDLVALSLSIFNFNAAMLDLAALSNQSMGMGVGGFVRDLDEQPEAEDDSDEDEEDEEGEEKVWSDCESIQSSGWQSAINDGDGNEDERSRVEDSENGSVYGM